MSGASGGSGAGGSGVVIIAYPIADAAGLTISGGTVTDIGATRYHLFSTVGNDTFSAS